MDRYWQQFLVDSLPLSDEELGIRLAVAWAAFQCEQQGVELGDMTIEDMQRLLEATQGIDGDTAKNAALEKALRKVASGDPKASGKLFRELLNEGALNMAALEEAVTGKRRQKENAKKSRTSAYTQLIRSIVEHEPTITGRQLLERLRDHEGAGVIESVDDEDGKIFWIQGGKQKSTKITGLKDALSRAKKNLKKN